MTRPATLLLLAAAVSLGACSSVENLLSGEKVDYRSAAAKGPALDVPPDLTQLSRDSRYTQSGGAISAAAYQAGASAPVVVQSNGDVAPSQVGDVRLERQGNERWLVTATPPEQLWPRLQAFWKDSGFTLVVDDPAAGVMETEWNENRAKLPKDPLRAALGRVIDFLYSTSERDKFRTRIERGAGGTSEIYVTHRGMEEVYSSQQKETTVWQPRPADPQLEAEFLARLMMRLGVKEETAKAAVAAPAPVSARARVLQGQPGAALQVDDGFDRAWRRVGVALDRSGFTVEDRDRAQGLYFVRYIDPSRPQKADEGFFSKLFSFGKSDNVSTLARYRIAVKADGERSTVSVLTAQGAPETSETGRRIVSLLVEDLK
ncbi:MAG: outer membrane protein assembly factor BamC [Piscinibacter sp.]|uniref:outer membrane protein assembly factor BamC n=1 Tax=Piscinibacter TaxID=1114981 RepID=UPI000FDD5E1C|nr:MULTISPECIES: outer membrane protein assembly factor BamC [Piscinibacter]MCW5663345.1 outer membrane protein assembly factor BamC [Piscinibacter sp.]